MRKSSESAMMVEGLIVAVKDIMYLCLGTVLIYYLEMPSGLLP